MGISLLFIAFACCALRRRTQCINGSFNEQEKRCVCDSGWTGQMCHRKMNCSGYDRRPDGSCVECSFGWQGVDCDQIDCQGKGKPNFDNTACTCEAPNSGLYCELQDTKDIYKMYNNMTSSIGPIGIITIFPVIIMYMLCEKFAKKRQLLRVEEHLNGTLPGTGEVSEDAIKKLLESKSEDEEELIP